MSKSVAVTKDDVISMLKEMAMLLELSGANGFKVRAFQNAARTMETFSDSLDEYVREGKLTTLSGIGKGIAADIAHFYENGQLDVLEELKDEFPSGLFDLFRVPNLGPKKIKVLYEELGIGSLSDLAYACQENRLLKLKGFGQKSQDKILEGVRFLEQNAGQHRYHQAYAQVRALVDQMQAWPDVQQISIAGSLRRKKEVVKDADILCSSTKPSQVMKKFTSLQEVQSIIASGDTKTSIQTKEGMQVDLRVVAPEDYATALHHFTGSKEHNTLLRSRAKKRGMKINEYGVFEGDTKLTIESEAELFKALDLEFIEPELREGLQEIQWAENDKLPNLVTEQDIQGFFHMHTTYSDGKHSLEEMVQAAIEKGYQYMGVSDHSQTAFYAHGLKKADIKKQHEEIDQLQKKYKDIRIFKGIESDILPDGSLDYSDDVLQTFDFVIGSVHANFQMDQNKMTERCMKALENPYLTMLGHPTGRILLGRKPFAIDMHRLIDRAASLGKIIELNASPYRLDIDWRLLPHLIEKGGMISINPDAHSIEGIDHVKYGVHVARKGGVEAKHVLNTLPLDQMEQRLEEIRKA